jgi:putative flavoprotein involved in K+ transport
LATAQFVINRITSSPVGEVIDTVVIGAGHAGLALSCYLLRNGTEHVVLERGQVGERWRTERWDSLVFQFPNWSLQLPDYAYQGPDPDGYPSKDEFIRFLEDYASGIRAPVRCNTKVLSLRNSEDGRSMELATARGDIRARNVVVATGPFQAPKIPVLSRELPSDLFQIHSRDYRNRSQLPRGATLVVGSGASGTQIAEELHRGGRKVILAVGRFHKTPRRYRGRDFYWWFDRLGYWHTPLASMPPEVKKLRFVVTAVDGGHDVDLRQYASDGIVLAGRLKSADQQKVVFHDDLEGTLTEADAWYDKFQHQMDEYADRCDPPLPAERFKPTSSISEHSRRSGVLELNIRNEDISSVVWATGYTCDFSWIKLPVLDGNGDPIHERGVTKRTGLFFLGLRRTYSLGSALVAGAVNDAAYIAGRIAALGRAS